MALKNCLQCGKVFSSDVSELCPECKKKEEDDYDLVYKYLEENPRSTADKVSEETGVDKDLILKFLRQGRLKTVEISPESLPKCISCGQPIESSKLCPKCAKAFEEKVKEEEKKRDTVREEEVEKLREVVRTLKEKLLEMTKKEAEVEHQRK